MKEAVDVNRDVNASEDVNVKVENENINSYAKHCNTKSGMLYPHSSLYAEWGIRRSQCLTRGDGN